MASDTIAIVNFSDNYQDDITAFMDRIEKEFAEPISHSDPRTKKMSELAKLLTEKYWVAVSNGKAVGTIGLSILSNRTIVLKRMFISPDHRRKGIADLLLNTLFKWAQDHTMKSIYLGTMSQFLAAHQFYERNGFEKIGRPDLPPDFPFNPVDTLFYYKSLE